MSIFCYICRVSYSVYVRSSKTRDNQGRVDTCAFEQNRIAPRKYIFC